MPDGGIEHFETQWDGNGSAIFAFNEPLHLRPADFDRINQGNIDVIGGSFVDGTPVIPPKLGFKIVIRVTEAIGAGEKQILAVGYTDKNGSLVTRATDIDPLLPEGTEIVIDPGANGIVDLEAMAGPLPGKLAEGRVEVLTPTDTVENFEDNWGPPTPDLE